MGRRRGPRGVLQGASIRVRDFVSVRIPRGSLGALPRVPQREDNIVAMRKNKRDENLQKRSNMAGGEVAMSEGALSVAGVPQNSQAQVRMRQGSTGACLTALPSG